MSVFDLLGDIIQNFMNIPDGRIVKYSEDFEFPTDNDLFIIMIGGQRFVLSSVTNFDLDTNEEISTSTIFRTIYVELYGRGEEPEERTHEIAQAIGSYYGQRVQEDNHITIWRNGQILDLTYIEGSASLHRFRVPVIISYVETKRTSADYFEHFPNPETEIEGR
jgi:hypothetical protein